MAPAKDNKLNAGVRQHNICPPPPPPPFPRKKTPRGYTFALLVANQLWRANQHEHARFGISSPWSSPSRSGILRVVVQPWLSLHAAVQRPLFSLPLHAARAPHQFSEHHTHFGSLVSSMCAADPTNRIHLLRSHTALST